MVRISLQDVRYAARQLRRTPGLTLAVVVTLALAIGAAATLFSVWNAIALRRLPVPEPDRLVALSLADGRSGAMRLFEYSTYRAFAAQQQVFEQLCAYSGGGLFTLEARGTSVDGLIAAVTPEFFDLLRLRPLLGRLIEPQDAPGSGEPAPVVVIGHSLWQRVFGGDRDALGARLVVDGRPLTVIGILPPTFRGLHVDTGADFYVPLGFVRRISSNPDRPVRAHNIIGRLRRGVTLEQARAAITAAWPVLQAETLPPGLSAAEQAEARVRKVQVASGASGFSMLRERYNDPLRILVGLAVVLLLIGCVNLSGLLLARAVARDRQFAVCRALGATRSRIARLLLIESLLLSLTAAVAAVPLAWMASRALGGLVWQGTRPLALSLAPDIRVLVVMGATAIMTALMIGTLPVIAASRQELAQAVGDRRAGMSPSNRWAKALVVTQVALALVLLFGASLFTASLGKLRAIDAGFRPEGLLFTRIWQLPGPPRTYDEQTYYPALVERLEALPGVRSVALSHWFPAAFDFPGSLPMDAIVRTDTSGQRGVVDAFIEFISPRFFQTIGATLRRGRDFTWADREGHLPVAIINETLARRLFPNRSPVGGQIRIGTDPTAEPMEVIGVANDVTVGHFRSPRIPVVFRPRLQDPMHLRVPIVTLRFSGDAGAVRSALGATVRSFGQERIRDEYVLTVEEQIDITLLQERVLAGLSSAFGGLAALLAFVGMYALLAHAVVQRTQEIGLRMAIGASRLAVVTMVVREGLWLTLFGIVLGVPCALVAGHLVIALLYEVQLTDPTTLAATSALAVLVGALACLLPARRAARIEPMEALRCE